MSERMDEWRQKFISSHSVTLFLFKGVSLNVIIIYPHRIIRIIIHITIHWLITISTFALY